MGASPFITYVRGSSPQEAFQKAVESAQQESGHGGYTGTIAEKDSFVPIEIPENSDPVEAANQMIDDSDERIDDKWGPAGMIDLGKNRYLFFGWASS